MTITIALAGKGGVGKTTTAGMIIKYLSELSKRGSPGDRRRSKQQSEHGFGFRSGVDGRGYS